MTISKTASALMLNRLTGGYPGTASRVTEYESVQHFLSAFALEKSHFPAQVRQNIHRHSQGKDSKLMAQIEADQNWLQAPRHSLVTIFDSSYPTLLRQIDSPPFCLHLNGVPDLLSRDQIAVVGSRKPTQTGLKIAKMISEDLSAVGLVVTSGLAYGIDAAAHKGALAQKGETIAVMGTGCDVIYPRAHERIAMKIIERGLLVSEFPLGGRGYPSHFPQRNRIVTGLSLGALIVEATTKSGSLISARLAMEAGREVFAVPGSIFSPQSMGCHQLLKEGAKLTQSIGDIVDELPKFILEIAAEALSERDIEIMRFLGGDPVSTDELHELTSIPIPELLGCLLSLVIEGQILEEPRGYVLSR